MHGITEIGTFLLIMLLKHATLKVHIRTEVVSLKSFKSLA